MSHNRFARNRGKVQALSVGIVVLTVVLAAFLVRPMLTSGRDLSTPSSRLVGHWETSNDRFLTHAIYSPVDASGRGTCADTDGTIHFTFEVVSEDRAGTKLVLREYDGSTPLREVELSVAQDGRSMTKTYRDMGMQWTADYEYQGHR